MTLEELARRCEAAKGADRELDAAIYDLTLHALDYQRVGLRLKDTSRLDRYHDGWVTVYGAKGEADPYPEDLPRYTTSLDAAMTLVPNKWGNHQTFPYVSRQSTLKWQAGIGAPGNDKRPPCCYAATPALALCAAALRARARAAIASQQTTEGE